MRKPTFVRAALPLASLIAMLGVILLNCEANAQKAGTPATTAPASQPAVGDEGLAAPGRGTAALPQAAAGLVGMLRDPDKKIRNDAITRLRLMARRVDRSGGQRVQKGAEFPPQVEGLVPWLVRAAHDDWEMNRLAALYVLADTLDPDAVAEIRRRLDDPDQRVRLAAACLLTEFHDASGIKEMRKALDRLQNGRWVEQGVVVSEVEQLLASLERITGKSFGPIPANPMLMSDSRQAEQARRRYDEMLNTWAAWWAWEPPIDKASE